MYSTHNEGKFVRTLKNKIYKYITLLSKSVFIDKLDDIVNKCNNTYHSTIKMKPVNVKSSTILTLVKKVIIKILNLKLVILLEYQNIKMFLKNVPLQIGLKKFLWLKKLKIVCRGYMLLSILWRKNCWNVLRKRISKNKSKRI